MDPFYVLELEPGATDGEVVERYRELVLQYPPDRAPREFAAIREAYEALRDRRARLDAELFSFDPHGRALVDFRPIWRRSRARRRLSRGELARALRRAEGEEGEGAW